MEAPSTALPVKQVECMRLQDSQPAQKTAPRTLAITGEPWACHQLSMQ